MPPKPSPTHFLCIPLVTKLSRPQLASSLASFSADVTSPDSYGFPPESIRPLGTLHLTLGVMSFPRNEGLDKAVELLKTLAPRQMLQGARPVTTANLAAGSDASPAPGALTITLRGLHAMQPAARASVLYSTPADEDGTLLRLCEQIKAAFQAAGLMLDENRPLLLHATILNTLYVKAGRRGQRRERLTVDARGALERYDDFVFMRDVAPEKIAICRMGAKEQEDGDQAYEVEAEIDFQEI
jgi:activating signal cointegrator complex subunit 1